MKEYAKLDSAAVTAWSVILPFVQVYDQDALKTVSQDLHRLVNTLVIGPPQFEHLYLDFRSQNIVNTRAARPADTVAETKWKEVLDARLAQVWDALELKEKRPSDSGLMTMVAAFASQLKKTRTVEIIENPDLLLDNAVLVLCLLAKNVLTSIHLSTVDPLVSLDKDTSDIDEPQVIPDTVPSDEMELWKSVLVGPRLTRLKLDGPGFVPFGAILPVHNLTELDLGRRRSVLDLDWFTKNESKSLRIFKFGGADCIASKQFWTRLDKSMPRLICLWIRDPQIEPTNPKMDEDAWTASIEWINSAHDRLEELVVDFLDFPDADEYGNEHGRDVDIEHRSSWSGKIDAAIRECTRLRHLCFFLGFQDTAYGKTYEIYHNAYRMKWALQFEETQLSSMLKALPNLEVLRTTGPMFSRAVMKAVRNAGPKIRLLRFGQHSAWRWINGQLTRFLPDLSSHTIHDNKVHGPGFGEDVENDPLYASIWNRLELPLGHFHSYSVQSIHRFKLDLRPLKWLNLSVDDMDPEEAKPMWASVLTSLSTMRQLVGFTCHRVRHVDVDALLTALSTCSALRHLHVHVWHQQYKKKHVLALVRQCTELETLALTADAYKNDVQPLTIDVLDVAFASCPRLRWLDLGSQIALDDPVKVDSEDLEEHKRDKFGHPCRWQQPGRYIRFIEKYERAETSGPYSTPTGQTRIITHVFRWPEDTHSDQDGTLPSWITGISRSDVRLWVQSLLDQ